MPSPPAAVNVPILAAKASRPTHYSSNSTRDYDPINSGSVRPISDVAIVDFRALIDLIIGFTVG